jgi:4-diphosphocytidyl-2-C-methyl-D-erythritol kinase
MRRIALKAYAKINLGLVVLGRREDGYHELRTIYQSVSLADDLAVSILPGAGQVRLEASGFAVPGGEQNLAGRAARAVQEELRLRSAIRIALTKRIPPGSGLGGASSDAAAVLRAVLSLSGKSMPPERLLHLAAGLGSDVPFFLLGGRALGVGRGEEVYPLPDLPRCSAVILFPGEGMNTAEAYGLLRRPRLTVSATQPTIELFCGRMLAGHRAALANDFEPLLLERLPRLAQAKRALLQYGAVGASLTGSGSALYGLFDDPAKARRAARALEKSGASVFVARTVSRRRFAQTSAFAPHPA